MSKIIQTMSGLMETDYPADAICDYDFCGHQFADHNYAYNCGSCFACDHPITMQSPGKNFHYFKPRLLAGGAVSASQELELYRKAMNGE